jgi:hypothetical protein
MRKHAHLEWQRLSGFHQVALRSGSEQTPTEGTKEDSDSYLVSNYLGPILGSKWLIMQTIGSLRLSQTRTFGGNLGKDVLGCHLDF